MANRRDIDLAQAAIAHAQFETIHPLHRRQRPHRTTLISTQLLLARGVTAT